MKSFIWELRIFIEDLVVLGFFWDKVYRDMVFLYKIVKKFKLFVLFVVF